MPTPWYSSSTAHSSLLSRNSFLNSNSNSSSWSTYIARIAPIRGIRCDENCYSYYTVYRLGFALAFYHILQAVALIGVEDGENPRTILHEGFWPAKVLLLIGLSVGSFWIPFWIFDYLFYLVVLLGFLFLIIQGILLVDLAFDWAEGMLDGASEGKSIYQYLIIGSTATLLATVIGVLVSVYLYFDPDLERTLMTATALILVLMTICSALPSVQESTPSSGIFQSSMVGLYLLLVQISAFISSPTLPKVAISASFPILSKTVSVFNVVFAYLAVAQASFSNTSSIARLTTEAEAADPVSDEAAQYSYTLFHCTFAFAAIYTILYTTFWQYSDTTGLVSKIVQSSLGFWARIVASWCVGLIFVWILFAPIVLQERLF